MSTRRTVFAAAIALAVVACTDTPVAVETDLEPQFAASGGRRVVHSATGSGHVITNRGIGRFRFSFIAQEYEDGSSSGQFQTLTADGKGPASAFFQGEVTCVSVGDDPRHNNAWIGGVITRSHDPGSVGQGAWCRVEDDFLNFGERADLISRLRFGTLQDALDACADKHFFHLFFIRQGNIQVAASG